MAGAGEADAAGARLAAGDAAGAGGGAEGSRVKAPPALLLTVLACCGDVSL